MHFPLFLTQYQQTNFMITHHQLIVISILKKIKLTAMLTETHKIELTTIWHEQSSTTFNLPDNRICLWF